MGGGFLLKFLIVVEEKIIGFMKDRFNFSGIVGGFELLMLIILGIVYLILK